MSTRREITRAATVAEIKSTALELMHQQGSPDVPFADIARAMSMTAPALYRYFSGRDELVTALTVDAFDDLADRLEKTLADTGAGTPADAFARLCQTYRGWALEDRVRFALVFGLPVAGYTLPEDGPRCAAGERAFGSLAVPVLRAREQGLEPRSILPALPERVAAAIAEAFAGSELEPVMNVALLHGWAAVHGFVSLEAFGHLGTPPAITAAAFDSLLAGIVSYLGLGAGTNATAPAG